MSRVEELDWWQEREYGGVRFVCLPSQHFSQRTLWDGNTRLWATWAVLGRERRFYFSGDTAYFAGFKEIGKRLGPFDVAAVAIGAYEPPEIMKSVHVTPEEAVQAFVDVNARRADRHPLGHLRSGGRAAGRAARAHARRGPSPRHRLRARLDPQTRGNAPVVKSLRRMGIFPAMYHYLFLVPID